MEFGIVNGGSQNGIINGDGGAHSVNGSAGPSRYPQPYATPPATHHGPSTPNTSTQDGLHYHSPSHNEQIVNHIYTSGFQHGNYADINLHVLNRHYRLHAIILSRSPYLAHLINTTNTNTLFIPLEHEPLITEEGFAVALGYLYSSVSMSLINRRNARAVLAAACLLGGMDDLAITAYQHCRESIAVDTMSEWLQFLESTATPDDASGNPSGMVTGPAAVLGPYAKRLRDDVFSFLVVNLPISIQAFSSRPPSANGQTSGEAESTESGFDTLLRIYSMLPFDIFKHAVESPAFPAGEYL
ncbi:hypothetical protein FRC03_005111 [Tulasnella sp. 419]|nr:hypothetical protein FRC03_005111 [Tulasnella sp. 419]